MMHRLTERPSCWTDTATPYLWLGEYVTRCGNADEVEDLLRTTPGCAGCARLQCVMDGERWLETGSPWEGKQ